MPQAAPTYDLLLLLSRELDDDRRAKILGDVESAIGSAGGSIENRMQWGTRPMAYEIAHQAEADYQLLQFKAPGSLLEGLSHDLRITDGVLRHRIIKLVPGTPPAPASAPPVVGASHGSAGHGAPVPARVSAVEHEEIDG